MDNNNLKLLTKKKLLQKEANLIYHKKNSLTNTLLSPAQQKIPVAATKAVEDYFEKCFEYIFEHGTSVIVKSFNRNSLGVKHINANKNLTKEFNKKNLDQLNRLSATCSNFNICFSSANGAVMGALGMGLPDIPLVVALILKNIYEIAVSYGFPYNNPKEKLYILYIISCSVCPADQRPELFAKTDKIAKIDEITDQDLTTAISLCSSLLSQAILMPKVIQGLPIVGVVGGVTNFKLLSDISEVATVKYKKRYLQIGM